MPHHHRLLTAALAVGLLCGFGSCSRKPAPPRVEVVELPVSKLVAIPSELTEPCAIAEGPRSEVFRVARERKASLQECSGRMQRIRELSDKAAEQAKPGK